MIDPQQSTDIHWHYGTVQRSDRERLKGHRGFTIWFTGLPCSGKSTIAEELADIIKAERGMVEVMDGDVVRTNLSKGLGFSREDRETNLKRIAFVCNLLTRNGVPNIGAAISPFESVREWSRDLIGEHFIEVFARCPVEKCIERDVKGMYKKALAGEIKGFTGIDDPYEAPERADVALDTSEMPPDQAALDILLYLEKEGYIARA